MRSIPVQDAFRRQPEQRLDAHLDLRALLDAAEAAPPAGGVDAMAAILADTMGATEVSLLIADISGLALARLARAPAPRPLPLRPACERLPIAGTPAGQALRTQRVQVCSDPHGFWVYVPVTERGEALGVLELLLAVSPSGRSSASKTLPEIPVGKRSAAPQPNWAWTRTTRRTRSRINSRHLRPKSARNCWPTSSTAPTQGTCRRPSLGCGVRGPDSRRRGPRRLGTFVRPC